MLKIRDLARRSLAGLSSLRLAMLLILLLIAACAIGGLIPQSSTTPQADAVYRSYGLFWYRVITRLQLDDVFGSPWFFVLTAAFALNLLLCTSRRFRASLRKAFRTDAFRDPSGQASPVTTLSAHTSADDLAASVATVLHRSGFTRLKRRDEPHGEIRLSGHRRPWGVLGADLVHVGILVVLLGALLGIFREESSFRIDEAMMGTRFASCADSSRENCVSLPYDLQIDAFGVETDHQTGRAQDYWADITLWQGEEVVKQTRVSVNHPLIIGGAGLYVWRYGEDSTHASVRIQIIDRARYLAISEIELRLGETVLVPGTQVSVTALQLYRVRAQTDERSSEDPGEASHSSPVVLLQVEGVSSTGDAILYRDAALPQLSEENSGRELAFLLSGIHLPATLDLHIARNPGYPLFWWGFMLVMAGLAIAFYFRPSTANVRLAEHEIHVYVEGAKSVTQTARLCRTIAALRELTGDDEEVK